MELTARHFWFMSRIEECIDNLKKLHEIEDWKTYKDNALILGEELIYAVKEWDKYYGAI